jgi:hypothetical protein
MSLPVITYDSLHNIIADKTRQRDEELISRIVTQIYNMVIQRASNRLLFVKWTLFDNMFDDASLYEYKHIVIAANRLRVLFPNSNVHHNKMKEITVDWR